MEDVAKQFIAESRTFLMSNYLPDIESCLHGLTDQDTWWRANENSNSIGNLLMHLEGSTRNWIISVAGESYRPRDRQREFDQREQIPLADLMANLKKTLRDADEVLARIDTNRLLEKRHQASEEVTILWAIYHAIEHFSMHTGQIIMLAKMLSKEKVQLSD